jgi:hypothetical protein
MYDVYITTRTTRGDAWSAPVRVVELCSAGSEVSATPLSPLVMMLASDRDAVPDQYDLYFATRSATDQPWVLEPRLADLDNGSEMTPFPRAREAFYFARYGAAANKDMYLATGPPFVETPITSLNTSRNEEDPWLSPDGSRMFFASDRDGTWDLFESAAR